ncbi:MAG TPA: 4-oxalocrotonate tautomerase family protein [Stellaceae bacterium]|nr:4-oxalocrotonate tautomerase family protein [Stellaceae bacterium]
MPVVRIAFYQGRSVEKKRAIAEAVTDALVRIGGSTRSGVHVIFENVAKEDWVIGGAPEMKTSAGDD